MSAAIDAGALRQVVPTLSAGAAAALAESLGAAMLEHDITTARRAAMFIAQVAHESGGFRYREEIASGSAYEGRRDLGNTRPGDGPRFKGRGFIMVTGRANYAAVGEAFGIEALEQPQLLARSPWAETVAAWWWSTHGCGELCDAGGEESLLAVTRRINGGLNGLDDRRAYWQRALQVADGLVPRKARIPVYGLRTGAGEVVGQWRSKADRDRAKPVLEARLGCKLASFRTYREE